MTADLNALGNLAGNIGKTVKPQKLSLSRKTKAKLNAKVTRKPKPEAKTPAASDVRKALGEGEITPLEAADLNPLGGLKPKASDVRAAYKGGKLSREEAEDLSPQANLNTANKVSKPKSSGKPKKEEPIKVSSERIYPTKEEPQAAQQVGFNRYDIPTHGPGSEYNPNAGRQWNNG
jgi:hypothetical protein